MRVLHLSWSYPSELFHSEGTFFRNMIEPLRREGVEVTVATPLPYVPKLAGGLLPRLRRPATMPRRYDYNGVRVLTPRYLRLPHSFTKGLLPRTLARAVSSAVDEKPDLVHAHSPYPYGTAALYLQRQWGIPVVLTLHGGDANSVPYRSEGDRRRFVRAVLGVDHVLAVSNELVGCVRDLAGREAQFWPIGVDLERFGKRPEAKLMLRRQLDLPLDQKLLLFVGVLETVKGVDLIPALMERLPAGIQSIVVGDGALRHLVRRHPRCLWIPAVPNSRLVEYMSAADVMLLPSRREGTPTVLVEAGAARLPVVASAAGGISDLLAGGRGLLAESENVESLAQAVQAALADSQASAKRAERLHAYIALHYDCKKNARALAQLYGLLAAGDAGGRYATLPDKAPALISR